MGNLTGTDPVVAIAFGAVVLLVAALALVALRRQKVKHPEQGAVIGAVESWVYKAILAGERSVMWGYEELDTRLAGVDKKAVADSVYNLLPPALPVDGVLVPINFIKDVVPREKFEQMVQDLYEETHGFILKNESYLASQVKALTLEFDDTEEGDQLAA